MFHTCLHKYLHVDECMMMNYICKINKFHFQLTFGSFMHMPIFWRCTVWYPVNIRNSHNIVEDCWQSLQISCCILMLNIPYKSEWMTYRLFKNLMYSYVYVEAVWRQAPMRNWNFILLEVVHIHNKAQTITRYSLRIVTVTICVSVLHCHSHSL